MFRKCPFCDHDLEIVFVNGDGDRYTCPKCGILETCPKCHELIRIVIFPNREKPLKDCVNCGIVID